MCVRPEDFRLQTLCAPTASRVARLGLCVGAGDALIRPQEPASRFYGMVSVAPA
jgi:hypothetical protein